MAHGIQIFRLVLSVLEIVALSVPENQSLASIPSVQADINDLKN